MTVNHDVAGSSPAGGARTKASRETCFFSIQSEGLVWNLTAGEYVIAAGVWHHAPACIFPSDWLHTSLRVDSIPQTSCGFHTRLRRDFTSCIFVLRCQNKGQVTRPAFCFGFFCSVLCQYPISALARIREGSAQKRLIEIVNRGSCFQIRSLKHIKKEYRWLRRSKISKAPSSFIAAWKAFQQSPESYCFFYNLGV